MGHEKVVGMQLSGRKSRLSVGLLLVAGGLAA
jgi:hypothetical protein